MELTVLGSNSGGNCYILQNDNEALILEAGISLQQVKKALDFNLAKVAGCLVTHEHGDHAKHVEKFAKFGIQVFMSLGTKEAINTHHYNVNAVKPKVTFNLGTFEVLPFPVQHDCAEPYGYLIRHHEIGTMLFITDSYFVNYKFPGLTNILVECNYCENILTDNVNTGKLHPIVQKRVSTSHMSLDTCIQLLKANDLSKVNNIVLIHLSEQNSDPEYFRERVTAEIGRAVHIAKKGLSLEFNRKPF